MNEEKESLKSEEYKNDMLFILKELHRREKITEKEYYKAVDLVLKGEYNI